VNTPYDVVAYPNLCHKQTHPDRIAVMGELFGLAPASPEQCRMLELGCGDGTNLLPLAYAFPGSRFVGVDLAPTLIAAGRNVIADLGLKNLELLCLDVADYPAIGEPFDYVVAHGVYSWVPPEVRESLLAICRGRLAPQGIAYVSYNCLPGGHIRRMVREIMRFHVRSESDPLERVRQAVAVTRFIADSMDQPDAYRQVFKEQLEQIQRYGAGHLFHDDLAEINDPVYFHEFMTQAARHDLQYLAEAEFYEMQEDAFSSDARQRLGGIKASRLTFEQYLDFIKCRRFRQTLLCRGQAQVCSPPASTVVERFHISSQAAAKARANGLANGPIESFVAPGGGALQLDDAVGKAALRVLSQRWPATVPFNELFQLAAQAAPPPEGALAARKDLAAILLEAYRAGLVDFRKLPVRCATRPPERPKLWAFARRQIQWRDSVTTLRGDNLRIGDDAGKRLLELLDGSRGLDDIMEAMEPEQSKARGRQPDGRLLDRLNDLARFALLEAPEPGIS
jgi:SAM-dependent methyltransferase